MMFKSKFFVFSVLALILGSNLIGMEKKNAKNFKKQRYAKAYELKLKKIAKREKQIAKAKKLSLQKMKKMLPEEFLNEDEKNQVEVATPVEIQAPIEVDKLEQTFDQNKHFKRKLRLAKSQKGARRNTTKIDPNDWTLMGFGLGLIALVILCQYKFYHMNESD